MAGRVIAFALLIALPATRLLAENLFVTSPATDEVLEFDSASGALIGSFVVAGAGGLKLPTGLGFGPNGNLFVLSQGTSAIGDDAVLEFQGTTGAFVGVFHAGSTQILWNENGSGELTWGTNGDLYASNWVDNFGVEAVRLDGASGDVVSIFDGCLWRPQALALGQFDQVFLASRGPNAPDKRVFGYDAVGNCLGAFTPSVNATSSGIEFGPNGNLFVGRPESQDIAEYDGATGGPLGSFIAAGSGGLSRPGDLKFGPNDNLFVIDLDDGRILEFDGTTGGFIREFASVGSNLGGGDGIGRVHLDFRPTPPHCNDGIDNDGDGLADLQDPGCDSSGDPSELSACEDGIDNDGDSYIDASDPGCDDPSDSSEQTYLLRCDDGRDNDLDGLIDAADPQCASPWAPNEEVMNYPNMACGLGPELAAVLPLLGWLTARRRTARARRA